MLYILVANHGDLANGHGIEQLVACIISLRRSLLLCLRYTRHAPLTSVGFLSSTHLRRLVFEVVL